MKLGSAVVTSFAFGLPLMCSGCEPPQVPLIKNATTISYDQIGACTSYEDQVPGQQAKRVTADPNTAYVIFNLTSVDNTTSSIPIDIDAWAFLLDDGPRTPMNHTVGVSLINGVGLGSRVATPIQVPSGTRLILGGLLIVAVAATPVPAETLLYRKPNPQITEPSVFMVPNNTTASPQANNCEDLRYLP